MSIHVCFSTKPNCWNFEAKCYGTCYGCGCCVSDKQELYKNRVAYLNEMLKEQYEFDRWDDDPELKALQERNVKTNIRYFKRLKRYYEKKLKEVGEMSLDKVIKGLEEISDYFFGVYHHSKDGEEINKAKDRCDVVEDALALLKEQEPVEPKEIINDFYPVGDYRRTLGWHCGKCGRTLMGDGDFCSYCGRAVKWDG